MTVPRGKDVYTIGRSPCTGLGVKWSDEELDTAINGRVASALYDDDGKAIIEEVIHDIFETDFKQDGLRRVFSDPGKIESWRVGEAIAETWLTDHHDCYFPWPIRRDERKSGSSLPGADLVGLQIDIQGDCLAFGEVKTSSDAKYPPNVMYGRTGLKKQLENLRDRTAIRDELFKYLCYRARGASWIKRFQQAGKRYLTNKSDVQLIGFLIRDVSPHENDVGVRVDSLGQDCPDGMKIKLFVLYLPIGRLKGIGATVIETRREGL